jgi:hypothetical protein
VVVSGTVRVLTLQRRLEFLAALLVELDATLEITPERGGFRAHVKWGATRSLSSSHESLAGALTALHTKLAMIVELQEARVDAAEAVRSD